MRVLALMRVLSDFDAVWLTGVETNRVEQRYASQ